MTLHEKEKLVKPQRIRPVSTAITALIVQLSPFPGGLAADRKPNFLFIYSDDHRWDRMAAGGVRFRNSDDHRGDRTTTAHSRSTAKPPRRKAGWTR